MYLVCISLLGILHDVTTLPCTLKLILILSKQPMDSIEDKSHSRGESRMKVVACPGNPVMAVVDVGVGVMPSPP